MLLFALIFALLLLTFRDYSISNDEEVQHRYGEMVVAYYTSGFTDRSLFGYKNLYLYGALFDIAGVLIGYIAPVDVFAVRHLLCAMTGLGGIVATWAVARLIAGPRAALLAAMTLAVCGAWYGPMFNHTKDIPFAAAMIGATYFLLRACRDLPRPRLTDVLLLGLLMGAALGQRALGLLLIGYVAIAIVLHTPGPFAPAEATRFFCRSLLRFTAAFVLAYVIMIAAWPWSALELFNPIRAIFDFTHFKYPIKTLLFGDTYKMAEVPRAYVPVYLAIKLPLILLLGAAIALLAAVRMRWIQAGRGTAFVAFTALFPVLMHVAGHGPAFSGMRHFTFVVPPLAVLAGLGFDRALALLESKSRAIAGAAFASVFLWFLWTGSMLARLHPHQYLYFNEFVGGLAGATHKFDTDYWVNIMHEAVSGLEDVLDREGRSSAQYMVAVCGESLPFEHEASVRRRLKLAIGSVPADFFIAPTHGHCNDAIDGKVILRIERMGILIGVVKDRRGITQPNVATGR